MQIKESGLLWHGQVIWDGSVSMYYLALSHVAWETTKKWRYLNNYHVIIFYLIYVDHLIENIFRTVSFLTFRTIECCSYVLSWFRFYAMNCSYWNLMSWKAFFPIYSIFFFEWRAKIFSLTIFFMELARLKFLRHPKIRNIWE